MSVAIAKWTLDEYHRMIEVGLLDDRQVELLNGAIVEMSPEGPEHAQGSTDAADGDYQSERMLTTGKISPVAFPAVEISVQQLLEG
ncbi:MAG: hypothetical protein HC840_21425 [Leptolyngbyaceae cyanobacterium RM2_2_4]|nr:hypothetical protein [Leptolyngbyaceae cyanobacterium SM1_4_3]NJN91979.1 hypothetical protein [Leptolyngbyaceae cyanobacterium SL_5_14]NJO51561.1 hypothetical protein [Leptolyngbyaceae cyanobacterium RM2_2_4]NJO66729.1 hypothetical protein [Leptolyngbyaceae cyanobacterium RM1_405_57]